MAPLPDFIPDSAVQQSAIPDFIPDSAINDPSFLDQLNAAVTGAGQVAKGYTLGFADEASAGIGAVGNKILDKIAGTGLTDGMSIPQAYNSYLDQIRAEDRAFQDQNPKSAMALQAVGGIASPVNKLMKGVGLVKAGLATGAATGLGEGEGVTGRLESALVGGALGGGVGTLFKGIGAAGKAALTSDLGLKVRDHISKYFLDPRLSEAGQIGSTQAAQELSPTQAFLLSRAKNISPDKLLSAERELSGALAEGVPMTLAESINDPNTTRLARHLANRESTMSDVGEFMTRRAEEAPSRIEKALEPISPVTSPYKAGEMVREGAKAIDQGMRREVDNIANAAFAESDAVVPNYKSSDVIRLIEHPDIAPSIERAKRAVAVDRKVPVSEIASNDATVVRKSLADLTARAHNKFDQHNLESGYAQQLKKALENATESENPSLKVARDGYAILSQMKRDAGSDAVVILKNIEDGRLEGSGKAIMSMSEKQIATLKSTFDKMGKTKEFKAGVRAYFQNILDTNTGEFAGNTDVVKKMVGDSRLVSRVKAALGETEGTTLLGKLKREQRLYKGMQALNPQSGTAGNLAEEAAFQRQSGIVGGLLKAISSPRATATAVFDRLLTNPPDETLAREVNKTLITDPARGIDDLRAILPMQAERYPYIDNVNRLVDALMRANARGTTTAGTIGATGLRKE